MTIHLCDICQKEMTQWLIVDINATALVDYVNISHLYPYVRKHEICKTCIDKLKESAERIEKVVK